MKSLDQFGLTREQATERLIDCMLDILAKDDNFAHEIFLHGRIGYDKYSDAELAEALVVMGLVEDAA